MWLSLWLGCLCPTLHHRASLKPGTLGGCVDGSGNGAPVTHVGDLGYICGSWLWTPHSLIIRGIWGMNHCIVALSLCISQMHNGLNYETLI